jgi:acetyl-CoA carboxylase, biotin carboxylase subunit
LRFTQDDIVLRGAAIECQINAEDPTQDFRPNPGRIDELVWPAGPGVRIDSLLYPGYSVPPFYNSLLAKLIVHDESRPARGEFYFIEMNTRIQVEHPVAEAVTGIDLVREPRLSRELRELRIGGVKTTAPLHQALLDDDEVRAGRYHTNYLEAWMDARRARPDAAVDARATSNETTTRASGIGEAA